MGRSEVDSIPTTYHNIGNHAGLVLFLFPHSCRDKVLLLTRPHNEEIYWNAPLASVLLILTFLGRCCKIHYVKLRYTVEQNVISANFKQNPTKLPYHSIKIY